MTYFRPAIARAFSLIEIIIVVSILAILAAVVIPRFANSKDQAAESALMTSVNSVNTKLTDVFASTGDWPATIESSWFIGGEPNHMHNVFGVPMIEVVDTDGLTHPADKTLKSGVGGAYWYNAATGVFRARVADQGSEALTLAMYNKINNAEESSLGNY